VGLGDAETGFSAREAEERLEAEGFAPSTNGHTVITDLTALL